MTNYQKWSYYYSKGWATKAQLQQVVKLGGLTREEYEQITGEPFPAPEEESA